MRDVARDEEDEEVGSLVSEPLERPPTCGERARDCAKCWAREGPGWVAGVLVVVWVFERLVRHVTINDVARYFNKK